jgi:hypothetical protein
VGGVRDTLRSLQKNKYVSDLKFPKHWPLFLQVRDKTKD